MITTVTTSTITTITTITTMLGFGVALGVVALVALALFLCAREIAATSDSGSRRLLAKSLDVSIAPLVIAFVMIVVLKLVEIVT